MISSGCIEFKISNGVNCFLHCHGLLLLVLFSHCLSGEQMDVVLNL